jgi:hypothetical protein
MKAFMRPSKCSIILVFLIALPGFCQTAAKAPEASDEAAQSDASAQAEDNGSLRADPPAPLSDEVTYDMVIPAPVSMAGYSLSFSTEQERTNYLFGGATIESGYGDNIETNSAGHVVSDISYSVHPTFGWRESTSRTMWKLEYAPGFTFYQHNSYLNHSDQNVMLDSSFRLSPHVTLELRDTFAKTSNALNQFGQGVNSSPGLVQPVSSVVSSLTDQIFNIGSAQVRYQFGRNSMVGVSGLFSDLHYLHPSQVPGLFDSNSKSAEGFYLLRMSGRHYVGTRYQFQTLLTTPNHAKTEAQSVVLFYTLYFRARASLSFFTGPQYVNSYGPGLIGQKFWTPSYGASLAWEGTQTSFAMSAGRSVSAGGGLQGALQEQSAAASIRRKLTKTIIAELSAYYSSNDVLQPLSGFSSGGRTTTGMVSLHRRFQEHLDLALSYGRLHQSYPNISALATAPNGNRVWLTLSYQFAKPIGR